MFATMVVSHIFVAVWYLLVIERNDSCWQKACSDISLVRSYLLHSGYEDAFNSFDVPPSLITDAQTYANTLNHRSTLRQLITNGNIDGAFAQVHEWYPQIVEDCIALRAYEMPLEDLANAVNALVLSTDPHMKEAKDCLHASLERLLKQLTVCNDMKEQISYLGGFSKRD